MKRSHLVLLLLLLGTRTVFAQDTEQKAQKRPASFGFGVVFNDFITAERIQNAALESVINNKQAAKLGDMAPGLNVTYATGLKPKIDFAANLGFSSGTAYLENKTAPINNTTIVSLDASVQFKMFPESFRAIPYLSAGVGTTIIKGYYGAIMPLGVGFRFRVSDEFGIGIQSQYRVAVTETAGNHLSHGLTIYGKL